MFRSIQRGDYLSRSFIFSINLPHTNTRLFLHLVPPGLVLLFVAPPHPNLRRVHLLLRVLLLLLLCGGRRARGGCFQESPQVHRYQSHVILRTKQKTKGGRCRKKTLSESCYPGNENIKQKGERQVKTLSESSYPANKNIKQKGETQVKTLSESCYPANETQNTPKHIRRKTKKGEDKAALSEPCHPAKPNIKHVHKKKGEDRQRYESHIGLRVKKKKRDKRQ